MAKQKRKLIENLLFEVYDKGLQQNDCNLTDYYEKILQALNIPLVSKSVCKHEWIMTADSFDQTCYCKKCGKSS